LVSAQRRTAELSVSPEPGIAWCTPNAYDFAGFSEPTRPQASPAAPAASHGRSRRWFPRFAP
jgi:hypothetical protein